MMVMHIYIYDYLQQYDELIQELNRTQWEVKKLNEMLSIVCKYYHDSGENKKRKFDELENFGHSCCDECSPGRPREMKSNISRVHVRIDPSDTSLVSNLIYLYNFKKLIS